MLAGAASDGDIVFALFGHVTYLQNHRGITHSLLMLPLWAWLLALACALLARRGYPWQAYYGVILLVILVHIMGDLITAYGTQILAPLSNWAPSWNTTFIIDLWFTGLLLLGVLASFYWRPRAGAALGLAAVVTLVLFQYSQYRQAVALADDWATQQGYHQYNAEAYPQPWSPFNWKLVVDHGESYHLALVNLRRQAPAAVGNDTPAIWRLRAAYQPVAEIKWQKHRQFGHDEEEALAREIWAREEMAFFRWFANYPTLHGIDRDGDELCVIFHDLRFKLEGLESPFRYGMCRESQETEWKLYRWRSDGERRPIAAAARLAPGWPQKSPAPGE